MPSDAMNVRGPCTSCGAQLATDQRYCIECGQRVGPPMALPYVVPGPRGEPTTPADKWFAALPMPLQTMSTFAALALGFGVVVGTAISPNLAGIVAAPGPTVVAEAPPETPSSPATGGSGGGGGGSGAAAAPAAVTSTSTPTSSGGGGGGGDGKAKKKKKKKAKPQVQTFMGTVVRVNPVAQSYTLATPALIAIHADTLPQVGAKLESPVRRLANGTYAENGTHNPVGTADSVTFAGTVTYCADLEQPAAPCDGTSPTDHYAYTVSGLGASILVSAPHPAAKAPPKVGSSVQVTAGMGGAFQPIEPATWATDPSCTPAYDEQKGKPEEPVVTPELTETTVSVNTQSTAATFEAVVQTVCPGDAPKLVLSADDVRESGRDLAQFAVPAGIDLGKLSPGEAVQVGVDVADDGKLTLRGTASDQGVAGADDGTQGQGTLVGS
jgi:hypothetical protein